MTTAVWQQMTELVGDSSCCFVRRITSRTTGQVVFHVAGPAAAGTTAAANYLQSEWRRLAKRYPRGARSFCEVLRLTSKEQYGLERPAHRSGSRCCVSLAARRVLRLGPSGPGRLRCRRRVDPARGGHGPGTRRSPAGPLWIDAPQQRRHRVRPRHRWAASGGGRSAPALSLRHAVDGAGPGSS